MGYFVAVSNNIVARLNINGTVLARSQYASWVDSNTIFARVKKGDVLTLTGNSLAENSLKFVPQLQY